MLDLVTSLMELLWLGGPNVNKMKLVPGTLNFISDPVYQEFYSPRYNSTWLWTADPGRQIHLSCTSLTSALPNSKECSHNALVIQDKACSTSHRYCENARLNFISQSNELTTTRVISSSSRRDKFICSVESVSKQAALNNCICGGKNHYGLVGDGETEVNEYPMMAGLIHVTLKILFCGATIINKKQVLTAAHCIANRNTADFEVMIGAHDLASNSETNATRIYRVKSFRVHPQYSANFQDYDLALVTIRGRFLFNQQVGPVCLPFQHTSETFIGNDVDILGWKSNSIIYGLSNTLQKARLSVIKNTKCMYGNLTTRQLCTHAKGKDSCEFSSGGPVLWQNPDTQNIVQIGILTLGAACDIDKPAASIRVGAFVDWITANTHKGSSYWKFE